MLVNFKRYFTFSVCLFAVLLLILGINAAKNGSLSLLQSSEPSTVGIQYIGEWFKSFF